MDPMTTRTSEQKTILSNDLQAARARFGLGDLAIDHATPRVTLDGNAVELTVIEHELPRVLASNTGKVETRDPVAARA